MVGLKEVVAMPQIAYVSPLQVRDPQHKPNGTYGRRLTDFDIRASVLATVLVLGLVLGGSLWSAYIQVFKNRWNDKHSDAIVPREYELRIRIRMFVLFSDIV